MTKLVEWVTGAVLFAGVWGYLYSNISAQSSDYGRHLILFLPFYVLLMFAAISVSIIAWRVYTFNDCEEAARELKQEIKAAKEDLKKRGLKVD